MSSDIISQVAERIEFASRDKEHYMILVTAAIDFFKYFGNLSQAENNGSLKYSAYKNSWDQMGLNRQKKGGKNTLSEDNYFSRNPVKGNKNSSDNYRKMNKSIDEKVYDDLVSEFFSTYKKKPTEHVFCIESIDSYVNYNDKALLVLDENKPWSRTEKLYLILSKTAKKEKVDGGEALVIKEGRLKNKSYNKDTNKVIGLSLESYTIPRDIEILNEKDYTLTKELFSSGRIYMVDPDGYLSEESNFKKLNRQLVSHKKPS